MEESESIVPFDNMAAVLGRGIRDGIHSIGGGGGNTTGLGEVPVDDPPGNMLEIHLCSLLHGRLFIKHGRYHGGNLFAI